MYFSQRTPELVIVYLGGIEFNHQGNFVPSKETLTAAYEAFTLKISNLYMNPLLPTIVSICGHGDPDE